MADEEVSWKGDYFRLPIEDQVFISRVSECAVWMYKNFFKPMCEVMDAEFIDGDLIYESIVENFAPHIYIQKEVLRYVDEHKFEDSYVFNWMESGDNPMDYFPVNEPEHDQVDAHEIMMLTFDMLKNYRNYKGVNIVEC